MTCLACGPKDESCRVCDGTRRLPMLRCPYAMAGPRERLVVECVAQLEGDLPPCPGPWLEWPATLIDAMRIVAAERAEIRKAKE